MKTITIVFAAVLAVSLAEPGLDRGRSEAPYINRPTNPTTRYRRSPEPEPQGSIVIQGTKPISGPERRPTISATYQHDIWRGKNGQISAGGGVTKFPDHRWTPTFGVQGSWRFRRSPEPEPEPQGSIVLQRTQNLDGPERRPAYNAEYQHKFFQGKDGHFSVGAGATHFPGRKWEPSVGASGTWRFRRSPEPEPEPQGSIVLQRTQNLDGPERRPAYNAEYQHNFFQGKDGHFSVGAGATHLPGRNWEPSVSASGTWRFRRSPEPEPQGSIVLQGTKPLSGPEQRPTITGTYQHNIWEGKNGHVSAGGGVAKYPGHRWEPTFGIQGQYRFRRSAEPEPQGSIVLQRRQNLDGPERRPAYNAEYQHKFFQGKDGHFSVGAGATHFPGRNWEPSVSAQGSWRFRRDTQEDGDAVDEEVFDKEE